MKTYTISKKDLNSDNEYIGKLKLEDLDGNLEIDENLGYVRVKSICAKGYVHAKAGSGIKAGDGIKAGWGIEAGLSISCKLSLNIGYRIFAGIATWKKSVTDEEKTITCSKLESGEVCYGILNETGENESKKKATELREKADELLRQATELEESL